MRTKYPRIEPSVRHIAYSTAPTATTYLNMIDWYFPQAKKNEHPAVYVGRVARFMREWNGLTLRETAKKFKISYMTLWRIEKGRWQHIKTTNNYLVKAYGLQMHFDFAPFKEDKESDNA